MVLESFPDWFVLLHIISITSIYQLLFIHCNTYILKNKKINNILLQILSSSIRSKKNLQENIIYIIKYYSNSRGNIHLGYFNGIRA